MNKKQQAQKELKQLKADFKKRTDELERIINGSGFDWDFEEGRYTCFGDGEIAVAENRAINDYMSKNCFTTNNKKYAKQLAKVQALNSILMQLAEHFNPKGWEPDWGDDNEIKEILGFCHKSKKACINYSYTVQQNTIYFHPDVIADVIKELENNREKWCHLLGWSV